MGAKNKGSKSLNQMRDLVIREAHREVKVQDKTGPITLTVAQAALRALGLKAAQGNVQASKHFTDILGRAEAAELKEKYEILDNVAAYKSAKRAEIREYEARGEEPPRMLPHPDDIEIDFQTGEVAFHGPVNEDDLRVWERVHATKAQAEEEIRAAREELAMLEDGDETAAWIEDEIEGNRFILMTACLSIARRWKLASFKVRSLYLPYEEFSRHLRNGTDPKPPKRFEKIVEQWKAEKDRLRG